MKINYLSDEFSDDEILQIPLFVEEFWSNYDRGTYEGQGHLLMRTKDGLYHLHDCSHCSCYGPLDRIHINAPKIDHPDTGSTLDELWHELSVGYQGEVEPLMKAAGWTEMS